MSTENPTNVFTIRSKGEGILVRTAKGRLSYPSLFSPNKDDKYSASLLFPKNTDLSVFNEAVDLAAKAFFGPDYAKKYPKLKKPTLVTAESPAIGADAEAFPVFIRTSTKADPTKKKPKVVGWDPQAGEITDPSEAYAGRWAILSITVKGYDRDGNKGVTCYLNNVQLLEHGDPLGGASSSPSDDFVAVDVSQPASAMFE
jgi:hypothetical protein